MLGIVGCGSEDVTCLDDDPACAASGIEEGPAFQDSAPLDQRLKAIHSDLGLGSRGPEVQAVHEYLTAFGYYPNEDLQRQYALWQPIVGDAPEDPAVYDQNTVLALTSYQRLSGLQQTGIVDEATRALMVMPRCGVPDGLMLPHAGDDLVEKFTPFFYNPADKWPQQTLIWTVVVLDGQDLTATGWTTAAEARTALINETQAAINQWSAAILPDPNQPSNLKFSFQPNAAQADMTVRLASIPQGVQAQSFFANESIHFHNLDLYQFRRWSTTLNTPAGAQDVQTTLLHELGHVLGLGHSSTAGASMQPGSPPNDRTLSLDDKVAVSALYDHWRDVTEGPAGAALDIGIGADGADVDTLPDVWVLGSTVTADGGRTVHKYNGSTFGSAATGNRSGLRIAVSQVNGRPWVIGANHRIYERSTTLDNDAGVWQQRGTASDCAFDIGVGGFGNSGAGAAWIIGCDGLVYEFNGSVWVNSQGAGSRITVDAAGTPWVLASDNTIWRKLSGDALTGTWQKVKGSAIDIGGGPTQGAVGNVESYVFSIAPDQSIWGWDEQTGLSGDPYAPKADSWLSLGGAGREISAGPDGVPWVVANNGTIWRQF